MNYNHAVTSTKITTCIEYTFIWNILCITCSLLYRTCITAIYTDSVRCQRNGWTNEPKYSQHRIRLPSPPPHFSAAASPAQQHQCSTGLMVKVRARSHMRRREWSHWLPVSIMMSIGLDLDRPYACQLECEVEALYSNLNRASLW